jgi:hypothetical protein
MKIIQAEKRNESNRKSIGKSGCGLVSPGVEISTCHELDSMDSHHASQPYVLQTSLYKNKQIYQCVTHYMSAHLSTVHPTL